MTASTIALYHFDEGKGTVAHDDGPEKLHGRLSAGARWNRSGRFGGCLECNGVNAAMAVRHNFAAAEQRTSFYLCPNSDPSESAASVFGRVFEGRELHFKFFGHEWFATKDSGGVCQWGPWKRGRKHPGGILDRRGATDQMVLCTDSPYSGFRQQTRLRRRDGRLHWWYACPSAGGLYYCGLVSKSVVWQKGRWTKVEIEVSVKKQKARLYIDGSLESESRFPAARPTHHFIVGASYRDGAPFAGLIDELEITSLLPPESRLFPDGDMEGTFTAHGEGLELAQGFTGVRLEFGEDQASRSSGAHSGQAALGLSLSGGHRGLKARVGSLRDRVCYEVSVFVRGQTGVAQLAVGPSSYPELAQNRTVHQLTGEWDRVALRFVPAFGREVNVFVLFERPGKYLVDDLRIIKQ